MSKPAKIQSYVINLAEVKFPEIQPVRIAKQTDKWVKYGDRNDFPTTLSQAVTKAPEHSNFIKLRKNLIAGEGFTYSENLEDELTPLFGDDTPDDWLDDAAKNLSILESFAVEVHYNEDQSRVAALNYVDASMVRPSRDLDEKGRPAGYYVCFDWSNITAFPPKYFPRFDPSTAASGGTQMYFYHEQALGQPWLPVVSYASALNWVELKYELSIFGLNSVLNGFFASAIIHTKANMSDEQKVEYKNQIQKTFSGAKNAGKLMVMVSEKEDEITVTPLSNQDNTPMLKALSELITDNIVTAHGGDSILANVARGGQGLGSDRGLYAVALEVYENTVIRPFKKAILSFLGKVLEFNKVGEYDLDIKSLSIVQSEMPESFKLDILKPEVIAAEYGYAEEDLRADVRTSALPNGPDPSGRGPSLPAASPGVPAGDQPIEETPAGVEAEAKANLRGSVGGVQGILNIQQAVKAGLTDYSAAIAIFDLIYGIPEADAKRILGTPSTPTPTPVV